ncbi:MAG: hypothetical protein LUD77_08840 [Clostridiales bacterium]|nr:hypothetical protein [Clostridiales bacterium]
MIQSITFGSRNTWDFWKLVPKERPVFVPPEVKTNYIDLPGGNGSIDLSESLTGYPVYENRTGSFKFYVMNGYAEWQGRYSDIMSYLHGQRMKAVLADDPDWYYYGRFSVKGWESGDTWSEIEIGYEVEPYKWYKTNNTQGYTDAPDVDEWYDEDFILGSNSAPVYPTVTVSRDVTARFVNKERGIDSTVILTAGTTEMPDWLVYGTEEFIVYILGTGNRVTISLEFPIGRL